jgi:pentose-5-phosphate-3-epimerase
LGFQAFNLGVNLFLRRRFCGVKLVLNLWLICVCEKQPAILPDGYEITNIDVVDENFNPDPTSEQDVIDKLKAKFKDFKIEVFL